LNTAQDPPKSLPSGRFNPLLGLLFLGIGVTALYFLGILPVLQWWRAQSWPAVPCRILESEVRQHADADGVSYEARIRYAYTYDGVDYESDRIHFRDGATSDETGRHAIVAAFPAGTEAVCYVDPANPDQAILLRTFSGLYLIGFPGILFIVAGLFLLVPAKSPSAVENVAKRPPPGQFPETLSLSIRPSRPGSIAVDLFAFAFLNGVALVFVTITYFMVRNSGIGENLPFILASGIFALAGAGYSVVYLFGRLRDTRYRMELQMTPGYLAPDLTATVTWRLQDRRRRTRELQIWLEARSLESPEAETVSLDHGNVVDTIILASTFEHDDMSTGQVQCALPKNLRLPKGMTVCWILGVYAATGVTGPALKAHHWIPRKDAP